MKKRPRLFIPFPLLALVLLPFQAHALAMRFTDVTLENVAPGTRINLRVARNLPLVLINQSTENDTDVVIEAMFPNAKELKDGYEPIPDVTWIQALPNHFHLGPKASASVDVLINIPDEVKYVGHHYEVVLWAHTDSKNKVLPNGGVMFQVGLRSRFRLSIGTMGPASLQREKALKKLATINTNFSLSPDNLYVHDIATGIPVDLKAEKKSTLKVVNQSDDAVSLKVLPVQADPNILPQAGYEYAPDYRWLEVSPQLIKVNANSIRELKLRVSVPKDPKFKGKKYMFLVQTSMADDVLPLAYYNMVYIETAP